MSAPLVLASIGGPPTSTWVPPASVVGEIMTWLNLALFVTLGLSIITVIIFGAMVIIDRNRGEPVSAVAPHVRAFQIALGVAIMSSAGAFATWLVT